MQHDIDVDKRTFLRNGLLLGAGGLLSGAFPCFGQSADEDMLQKVSRARADHVMVFGSPYDSAQSEFCPHMHQVFKHNVETMTEGRIFVDIKDSGRSGVGTELMAAVSRGQIAAALVSMSNLSRAAPALDILNIPFWAAKGQHYLNLIRSKVWQDLVLNPISRQGKISLLFHYLPGPRTITTTSRYHQTIRTPDDLKKVIFRIPNSKVLDTFYRLVGTTPVQVAWKDAAALAKKGRFDALDPCIVGLYNGPGGLKTQLGTISLIDSVHDGWATVISSKWLSELPSKLRLTLHEAAEKTFRQHLETVGPVAQRCAGRLQAFGSRFYIPNGDERAHWIAQCGHQRPEWREIKRQLLGSQHEFERLLEGSHIDCGLHYPPFAAPPLPQTAPTSKLYAPATT